MKKLECFIKDEKGASLIEILAAIVILSLALVSLSTFMYQNFAAIEQNKTKEEAIYVREDIKSWLEYRAQSQDVANLNQVVLLTMTKSDESSISKSLEMRKKHLILDKSGIQKDNNTNQPIYEESDSKVDRGEIIKKINYALSEDVLPEKLKDKEGYNKLYIGQYQDENNKLTRYLVKVMVSYKTGLAQYDPRTDGIILTISVYNKEDGNKLTETTMNWVAEY